MSAYSTADVEQTVIARALQVEAEAQQARHPPSSSRRAPSSPKRKRIPKKVGTSIASASSPLPIPLPIVHHDDPVTAAGSMAKKRLEDALAIRPPKDRTAPVRRPRQSEGEGERGKSKEVEDETPSVRSERQRLIDAGIATPFNGMVGVEKGFRRVSRPDHLQTAAPATTQRGERMERGERNTVRPSAVATPPPRSKPRVRSATPTLKPPRPNSSRMSLSATPPPDSSRSTSASSQGSARSEQPPSPALSVSELPARLTRARVKEEIKSIERAFKQKDREEKGVKEEEVEMKDEDADEGVRMMEEEEDEEERDGGDVKTEKESDEEWKGDEGEQRGRGGGTRRRF